MSILRVGEIEGSSDNGKRITMESGENMLVAGNLNLNRMSTYTIPVGTTGQRPASPQAGHLRFNTTEEYIEIYNGTDWVQVFESTGTSGVVIGTEINPVTNTQQIAEAGLPTGLYWIQPTGQDKYQMYVDMDRNGGAWMLAATVRTNTCQAHMTNSAVSISGTTGPRLDNSSTTKMADAWLNAFVSGSTYTGGTRYWLEATGFNKNMFVDSNATVDLLSSASTQNARTRVSLTYEGGISDRNPNTGTRGFGDHHTSGGTYFAWGRHPEQGSNCGFREDSLGASNGYLWIK